MKAALITETGPASVIQYRDMDTPEPGESKVLIKTAAVAVNPIDTYIRSGKVKADLPAEYVIGSDVAGTVEAVGKGATRFRIGDRVWGSNQGLAGRQGTFSEFVAVDECWLYATPHDVADEQVAAIALTGITAHLGLHLHAGLQSGEVVFVNGGTGGVGSAVVQLVPTWRSIIGTLMRPNN
jgi:NADPH2:quinone reductase